MALSTAQDDWQRELNVQGTVPTGTVLILKFKVACIFSIFTCIPYLIVQDAYLQQKP